MQGRISNGDKWDEGNIAEYAVKQADSLIKALNKEPQK